MSFQDHFSGHAADYAKFRPRYPASLFEDLAELCAQRAEAWDCGTGNGQAAVGLAEHFQHVTATDASAQQVSQGQLHPRVSYRVATERDSGLPSASVDLVTVAQALHWFDTPLFFEEVRRVLKPGGVIAVWCYGLQQIDERPSSATAGPVPAMPSPGLNAILQRYYTEIVGPYWPPERVLVEQGYCTIDFPFVELPPPVARMEQDLSLDGLLNYVGTWSATKRFEQVRGFSPLPLLERDLALLWGDRHAPRRVTWPLAIRVGRKFSGC